MGNRTKAQILANERRAVQLKLAKLTYDEIAEKVTYVDDRTGESKRAYSNAGAAQKAVVRALKRDIQVDAEQLRSEEIARLDEMIRVLWNDVLRGRVGAIDRVIALQNQLMKLVPNLAVPQRGEVSGPDGAPLVAPSLEEVIAMRDRLRAGGKADDAPSA